MTERIQQIPRTGESELNQMPGLLERHGVSRFYVTEKLDGFSFSFGRLAAGGFFTSTRDRMVEDNDATVFGRAAWELSLRNLHVPDGWVIQGELCGPKIRGNKLDLNRLTLFVFDVFTPEGYLKPDAMVTFCERVGLETVPVLARDMVLDDARVIGLATGKSTLCEGTEREGAVFRAEGEASDPIYGRVSFKVFNPAFPHIA